MSLDPDPIYVDRLPDPQALPVIDTDEYDKQEDDGLPAGDPSLGGDETKAEVAPS